MLQHTVTGSGQPPIVFVHGFACARSDWDAQVAHFSARHQTIAVDLRGHGATPGHAAECSVERNGADVATLLRALNLPQAVLVGHSMGCRVVVEAALQAPAHTAGVVLLDGSQMAPALAATLHTLFATPDGFATITGKWFPEMFTTKSDPARRTAIAARAATMPRDIGEQLLLDLQRYDTTRLAASLAALHVPVQAIQTTFSNERRERSTMQPGQTTPYLDMLRAQIPTARIAIIPDTGHFPQIDEATQTNALIDNFLTEFPIS